MGTGSFKSSSLGFSDGRINLEPVGGFPAEVGHSVGGAGSKVEGLVGELDEE